MANIVCKLVKKLAVSATDTDRILTHIEKLDLMTDEWTRPQAAWKTFGMVRPIATTALTYRLTSHDAPYLQPAQRRKLPLATCDDELMAAALHAGIPIYQP